MSTIPQPNPDFYIAGGTLDSTASSYVVREADKELLDTVKGGQFCYILTSRQMGKSSLMVRTASSLQESGVSSVIIDLSDRDTTTANLEQWYLSQVLDIKEQLSIHEDYTDWWQKQTQWDVVRRFTQFLTQIVLKKTSQPIVIFIDEIDSTLSLPFNCDDYFAMIRSLHNRRTVDPELKRLTFVLLGVASPSDLIKDTRRTPFNIGTRIQLTDFTIQEAQPLTSGLAHDHKLAEKILDNILFFTGGHPYLTQKACLYVAKKDKSQWNEAEASVLVEKLIEEMFLSETGQNTDDNLQFIRKRILSSKDVKRLMRNYSLILQKQIVLDNELDPILMELKLSGLVKSDGKTLVVRNVIFERVFDKTWIERVSSEFTSTTARITKPPDSSSIPHEVTPKLRRRTIIIATGVTLIAAGGSGLWAITRNHFPEPTQGLTVTATLGTPTSGTPTVIFPEPLPFTYRGHVATVPTLAWQPNGKRIASGSFDKTVQVWNANDGSHLFTYRRHSDTVWSVVWSPDGIRIASGSSDKTVQVWNANDGSNAFTYLGHSARVEGVAWSHDGRRIASCSDDLTVQIWNANDGSAVFTYTGHSDSVIAVAWSPDGKQIASGSSDKTVQVWNANDGSAVFTYTGHSDSVIAVAWSPDGKRIASGSDDRTVQIWNANDGSNVLTYTGHSDVVEGVAWSPDGKRIASGSDDRTVQIWNANDGSNVLAYTGHNNIVWSVEWSPDGKRIASGSSDGTVQVWYPM